MSLMTEPDAMRDYAGRFANHATNIHADAQKAYSTAEGMSGSGWTGDANMASMGTMEELMRAFRNIENQMTFVSDNLNTSAHTYEENEAAGVSQLKP